MENPTWVPRVLVRGVHFQQLQEHGGSQGVRDANALGAALARPEQRWHYEPASDEADLAAAYLYGIVRGHPFVDGNKRTGFVIALIFLDLNGFELAETTDEENERVVVGAADGTIDEATLAAWIRERLGPR